MVPPVAPVMSHGCSSIPWMPNGSCCQLRPQVAIRDWGPRRSARRGVPRQSGRPGQVSQGRSGPSGTRPRLFHAHLDRLRDGLIAHPQAATDRGVAEPKLVEGEGHRRRARWTSRAAPATFPGPGTRLPGRNAPRGRQDRGRGALPVSLRGPIFTSLSPEDSKTPGDCSPGVCFAKVASILRLIR